MITVETWQMFGGLAGIIILLGGVALALQRLGIIQPRAASAPSQKCEHIEKDLKALRMEFDALADRLERHYISEETWTGPTSRILKILERQGELLESQGRLLIRLDERIKSGGITKS